MGYTGSIRLNGSSVFSEGKVSEHLCIRYAEAYNKQKTVEITKEEIEEALKQIHNGVTSYSSVLYDIMATSKIIRSLTDLLGSYLREYCDDNGNFLLVAKMQNRDAYGNGRTINFYKKDNIPDIPEVGLNQRLHLKDKDIEKMEKARKGYIETISIFSMINELYPNERERYLFYVDNVYNIKNRQDILKLIQEANSYYIKLNELYNKKYSFAMSLTSILEKCKEKIDNGEKICIKLCEDTLYFYTDTKYTSIKIEDFFCISDLFKAIGTESCASYATISSVEEFQSLLKSFKNVKQRSTSFESILMNLFNEIKNIDEEFELIVGGGY